MDIHIKYVISQLPLQFSALLGIVTKHAAFGSRIPLLNDSNKILLSAVISGAVTF